MVNVRCSGQMPAEADFNLLDTARKVEVYGIRMHQAKVLLLAKMTFSVVGAFGGLDLINHIHAIHNWTVDNWSDRTIQVFK